MDFAAHTELFGKSHAELKQLCRELGFAAYKGDILFGWLQQGADDYQTMTNLSLRERQLLAEAYPLSLPRILAEQQSSDGTTVKLLLDYGGNVQIELVIMLYDRKDSKNRHTLCISTQAGCAMGCAFCATGLSGLSRDLTASEIVAEVLCGKRWLNTHNMGEVTNLVYMGMGEPFANYREVLKSLTLLTDSAGLNLGQRRITISTCGLAPQIRQFADEATEINLAISLHAPKDELRSRLMPVNRRYPLSELMAACDYYTAKTNRRVTYEYALLKDINDSRQQAAELAGLLRGRLAHVNLIPVNFVAETGFYPSSDETISRFAAELSRASVPNSIREKRGADIDGACGQLRRKNMADQNDLTEVKDDYKA